MDRLVLVASLRPGTRGQVLELLKTQASLPLVTERQGIFLSETEVVFFLEGARTEEAVREILDDPVRSDALSPWLPLFDGPLHRGVEVQFVEREGEA